MVLEWSGHSLRKAADDHIYVVRTRIWDAWNQDTNAPALTPLGHKEAQQVDRPREAAIPAVTLLTCGGIARHYALLKDTEKMQQVNKKTAGAEAIEAEQ